MAAADSPTWLLIPRKNLLVLRGFSSQIAAPVALRELGGELGIDSLHDPLRDPNGVSDHTGFFPFAILAAVLPSAQEPKRSYQTAQLRDQISARIPGTFRFVIEGAKQHCLHPTYIAFLERTQFTEDPDSKRDAENRRIPCHS